ncbi:uncharacterized protein LOC136080071 [Hydra vulgaris]|uniref:Uncharacterized protein LOC136080071 n=1 Tax=Hydra vulgaris TaxID=6087 RepID=A0ABM4BUB1_HYDVU
MTTVNYKKFISLLIIIIMLLCVCYRPVRGCIWEENTRPDNNGGIASVFSNTQNDCCLYCLNNFTDTFAAFFMDSQCTCLNVNHERIADNGAYYTYITRDPFSLNQSNYECGSYGSFTILTIYYVKFETDTYIFKVINMNLDMNLSTSILMMKPDLLLINYDGATVGLMYNAYQKSASNFFQNVTRTFKVGYINVTTQFAMSYTRFVVGSAKLIVFIKPFNVVSNIKNSNYTFNFNTNGAGDRNAFLAMVYIKNNNFISTGDVENAVFKIYYNEKLIMFKEYVSLIGGTVTNVTFRISFSIPNIIKFIIPRLRCGATIQFNVYFFSVMKNQQKVDSIFIELSATVYQNGSSFQQLKQNIISFSGVRTQNRVRNHRIIGDVLSILSLNDVVLLCEWAIDRTKNYCGFYTLEGVTTLTRLSALFIEPICFDNMTQNIYFQDKFGNVLRYNYLDKIAVRLPDTKSNVLQLPSITLPISKTKDSKYFCCDTQIGVYNGVPYKTNRYGILIANQLTIKWVQPVIYLPIL